MGRIWQILWQTECGTNLHCQSRKLSTWQPQLCRCCFFKDMPHACRTASNGGQKRIFSAWDVCHRTLCVLQSCHWQRWNRHEDRGETETEKRTDWGHANARMPKTANWPMVRIHNWFLFAQTFGVWAMSQPGDQVWASMPQQQREISWARLGGETHWNWSEACLIWVAFFTPTFFQAYSGLTDSKISWNYMTRKI